MSNKTLVKYRQNKNKKK